MKSFLDKIVFALKKHAKVIFYLALALTVILVILLFAGIILNVNCPEYYSISVTLLSVSAPGLIFSLLIWIFYWALTHDSMEQKMEKLASYIPPVEYIPAPAMPKMRFNFKEYIVREAFISIAEKYKLQMTIEIQNFEILPFGADCSPKKGYYICLWDKRTHNNYFSVEIYHDAVIFGAPKATDCHFIFADDIARTNYFKFADGNFICETEFNKLSDDEFFDIIEKLIDVMYGAVSIEAEKSEITLYRQHYQAYNYIFHVDSPDYYGYTETVTIGNFKFIINGGLENG